MKKLTLPLIIASSIVLASVSVQADARDVRGERPHHAKQLMREFKGLDLSQQQRQEIRQIVKDTRENNRVYEVSKKTRKSQMKTLMNMPAWDNDSAEAIVREQIEQQQPIRLNGAMARHQVYQLLTPEQKQKLSNKAKEVKNKLSQGKRSDKVAGRLAKALELTDEQVTQFDALRKQTRENAMAFASTSKQHRESLRALVRADKFDSASYAKLQASFSDQLVEQRVKQLELRYRMKNLLSEEQQKKMRKMQKRMNERRG